MLFCRLNELGKLSRIDTCIILFGTIFVPLYSHGIEIITALKFSIPFITICTCTFILNDINDCEKDKINHPERTLPAQRITVPLAIIFYFISLFLSLILLKVFIPLNFVFLYFIFFILLINYDYFVLVFPYLKNFYVSISSVIPIIILSYISPGDYGYSYVITSFFFFILGREIFMDINDQEGDGKTLIKIIGLERAPYIAIFSQLLGIVVLVFAVKDIVDVLSLLLLLFSSLYIYYKWFKYIQYRSKLFFFMKIQMLIGISFLL
ncbi:MAG: UbiA family prenyltransferase [Gammaproteobacteria bacterium]|nr:UbiA family prenyltransferase [Gammaproteobacteria bacterium]